MTNFPYGSYLDSLKDEPKRDNSAYLKAMKEMREAVAKAEAALGGPVKMEMKSDERQDGSYKFTMVFTRVE